MAEFRKRAAGVAPEGYKKWLIDNIVDYLASDDETKDYVRAKWYKHFTDEPFPELIARAEVEGVVDKEDNLTGDENEVAESEPKFHQETPRPESVVTLTPEQARVAAMVAQAEDEPPVIGNVKDLFHHEQGAIPTVIRESRTECSYRWADIKALEDSLASHGGIWVIVTQSNHGHLDRSLFGVDGAISYKASVLLCYTNRDVTEMMEKETARALSLKIDGAEGFEKSYSTVAGKEVAKVYREEPGVGDGYGRSVLTSEPDYDFGDTGSDGSPE